MTRILCLWLPNWPIQRLSRARPELSGRPLVLEAPAVRGSRVAACCRTSRRPGEFASTCRLPRRSRWCGDLAVEPYDPAADRQELRRLAAACERFSPCVALEEGGEPESLLLDVTNLTHLLGSEAELAAKVERFFDRRALSGAAGRGRHGGAGLGDGTLWGMRIASSRCRAVPARRSGSRMIQHRESAIRNPQSELSPLPVELLRIASDTVDLLHQLGIETIGSAIAAAARGAHVAVRRAALVAARSIHGDRAGGARAASCAGGARGGRVAWSMPLRPGSAGASARRCSRSSWRDSSRPAIRGRYSWYAS